MKYIFIKTIKEKWLFILIMCLISIITLWMYVSLFPTFSKQSNEYEKLLSQFPKEMWEMFGMQDGKFSMSSLEKFMSVEMYSLLWPIMIIIIFVNIGCGQIAGEIDKGTIQILLSLPISRVKLFISKFLAAILLMFIFCFVSTMSIIPLAKIYNIHYEIDVYLKLFEIAVLFTFAGFGISILFSTIFKLGKAAALSSGLFLIMYIINIIASLKDNLKNLEYLSFFHYLSMSQVLSDNKIEITSIVVFSLVALFTSLIALCYFNKRDISV
jgi:ABC-2 type transport system permease protein